MTMQRVPSVLTYLPAIAERITENSSVVLLSTLNKRLDIPNELIFVGDHVYTRAIRQEMAIAQKHRRPLLPFHKLTLTPERSNDALYSVPTLSVAS